MNPLLDSKRAQTTNDRPHGPATAFPSPSLNDRSRWPPPTRPPAAFGATSSTPQSEEKPGPPPPLEAKRNRRCRKQASKEDINNRTSTQQIKRVPHRCRWSQEFHHPQNPAGSMSSELTADLYLALLLETGSLYSLVGRAWTNQGMFNPSH